MPATRPVDDGIRGEQFRASRRAAQSFGLAGDVHDPVAARLEAERLAPVLDVGCGDGALAEWVRAPRWLGVDVSSTLALVARSHGPVALGDAVALPVADGSAGAVAALWMLYQLEDPTPAVVEARRVLRPGGLFVACTTARDDSPELLEHLGPQPPSSFDAEDALAVVAGVFGADAVEVDRWDAPLVRLPDRNAVDQYARSRGIDAELAGELARKVDIPLLITKRGCLIWARR